MERVFAKPVLLEDVDFEERIMCVCVHVSSKIWSHIFSCVQMYKSVHFFGLFVSLFEAPQAPFFGVVFSLVWVFARRMQEIAYFEGQNRDWTPSHRKKYFTCVFFVQKMICFCFNFRVSERTETLQLDIWRNLLMLRSEIEIEHRRTVIHIFCTCFFWSKIFMHLRHNFSLPAAS